MGEIADMHVDYYCSLVRIKQRKSKMREQRNNIFHSISGVIIAETDKAILLKMDDGREHWFPISHTKAIHRAPTIDRLEVAEWLLDKKEIDYGESE